jgi:hypothetical protein
MIGLAFFALIAIILVLPAIVVALENSGKRVGRSEYAGGFAVFIVSALVGRYMINEGAPMVALFIASAISLVISVWFYRLMVQRTRDLGRAKAVAFIGAIPLVGMLFQLYLLFPESQSRAR